MRLYERPEWFSEAACRGMTDVFFPSDKEGLDLPQTICASCPVRDECLDYALNHHVDYGVWGGTSERGRRNLRQARNGHGRPDRRR